MLRTNTIVSLITLCTAALLAAQTGCLLPATRPCLDVPEDKPGSCRGSGGVQGEISTGFEELFQPELTEPACADVGDPIRPDCGDLTFEGRCDTGILAWCEAGWTCELDCGPTCGWDETAGIFDCGIE